MFNYIVSIVYSDNNNAVVLVSGMVSATTADNAVAVGEAQLNRGCETRGVTAIRADIENTIWLKDTKFR
jgi:hypothetical protein